MSTEAMPPSESLPRLKLFLALSRTPHALLDLAAPAAAALLWLGTFPSLGVTLLGLITVFAGYTAVYALNDVVDYRVDQEKMSQGGGGDGGYLDAIFVRHPLAQGLLTFPEASWWVLIWAAVALFGAFILNPVCAYIFLGGCALEAVYCHLLRLSHLRTLVSGVVKTLGGVAAVLAVDPQPSLFFLAILFLWLFFWEIGGQNIPADWHDLEEDRKRQARTVPVVLGPKQASKIIFATLAASVVLGFFLLATAPAKLPLSSQAMALVAGVVLLLWPALQLYHSQSRDDASRIFNWASYYPAAILSIILISFWF